jgi:excisionase family DNA binding protein
MLGFRGHFSTKSRRYSTTLGALRDARAEWRRAQAAVANGPEHDTTYVLATGSSPVLACPTPKPGWPHPSNPPPERKESPPVADRYLTVAQVAELLSTTERFPRRLAAERRIAFVKVGRHVRIP